MSDSLDITRLIISILFVGYELWAFRNNKTISRKLLPIILMFVFSLVILLLTPLVGVPVIFLIYVILVIEISQIGAMLVVIFEIFLSLFGAKRSIKKALILSIVFVLLAVVYYLGQRVF